MSLAETLGQVAETMFAIAGIQAAEIGFVHDAGRRVARIRVSNQQGQWEERARDGPLRP